MLTAAQLASMEVTQEAALPDLCTILRPTKTTSSIGGVKSLSETTIASNVPCRATPAAMQTAIGQQARPIEVNRYLVRMAIGTNVQDRDILDFGPGDRMRVERVKDIQSYDTILTVECEIIS